MEHDYNIYNSVTDNSKVLDSRNNSTILQYLEAIKPKSPEINVGLKPPKELQLFKWLIIF